MPDPQSIGGKIKGLRWAFGEAAVIAKCDPVVLGSLAQRIAAHDGGNKCKANSWFAGTG